MTTKRNNRRTEILQALAQMLETAPGERITTAKLAKAVGVSEAALYRHFPSKARMFEGLIDFIESSILTNINIIMSEESNAVDRCQLILQLLLTFAERNPGMSRLLIGDALTGEQERLRVRIHQLFTNIESQLKHTLREQSLRDGQGFYLEEGMLANLLLAYADGRITQFVRSEFKQPPSENFSEQWAFIQRHLLQS